MTTPSRRQFLASLAAAGGALARLASGRQPATQPHTPTPPMPPPPPPPPLFQISLAQWSLHRALDSKQLDPLDFPRTALRTYDIDAVEYVNSFYRHLLPSGTLAKDLKSRCDDLGVRSVLIMCDGEGALGDPDPARRAQTVANHHKWADLAKALGCHSIRVNARSEGNPDEQARLAADGLHKLSDYCAALDLNCIVENHGGLSSHGDWLARVIRLADHPRAGTLPDFGNFYDYDRYKGVEEMMPFAKGVSAKSHDFDDAGNEKHTDYAKMLRIVLRAGYRGRLGIEYEGDSLPEPEGILATKRLLLRLRETLAPEFPR